MTNALACFDRHPRQREGQKSSVSLLRGTRDIICHPASQVLIPVKHITTAIQVQDPEAARAAALVRIQIVPEINRLSGVAGRIKIDPTEAKSCFGVPYDFEQTPLSRLDGLLCCDIVSVWRFITRMNTKARYLRQTSKSPPETCFSMPRCSGYLIQALFLVPELKWSISTTPSHKWNGLSGCLVTVPWILLVCTVAGGLVPAWPINGTDRISRPSSIGSSRSLTS
jgi:hypothetical protein